MVVSTETFLVLQVTLYKQASSFESKQTRPVTEGHRPEAVSEKLKVVSTGKFQHTTWHSGTTCLVSYSQLLIRIGLTSCLL